MNERVYKLNRQSEGISNRRVLVVGFRRPIIDVLKRLEIPFAVWASEAPKRELNCLKLVAKPFPSTSAKIRDVAQDEFMELGTFTDVIAGTESSVFPASVCRRALGARKTKDSIALRCSDKLEMKSLLKKHNISMTDFVARDKSTTALKVFQRLGPKVVVKDRRNSGGRGISFATSVEELESRSERGLLYEKFVQANELSIEAFIQDGQVQFESPTNYLVRTLANVVPANLPAEMLARAKAINRDVIKALKLKWGMTHAEFYWNDDEVLFGEIALRPPGGYIMECISNAYGFDAWEAFVANEFNVSYQFPTTHVATAGVAMFHAGTGMLEEVQNVEAVRELSSFVRFKSLAKPGDQIEPRAGVSEVSAYGMFVSSDTQGTVKDIRGCLELIRFKMKH